MFKSNIQTDIISAQLEYIKFVDTLHDEYGHNIVFSYDDNK